MVQQSESIGSLAMALVAAQGEFPAVSKDADNQFFKSKYADLPAIVAVVQPILAKHGLAICQLPGMDDLGDNLTTRLLHSSGEWIQATMRLHLGDKVTPQAQGSALTYARRYALSAILGIVTDEDDDGQAASKPKQAKRESGPQPSDVVDLPADTRGIEQQLGPDNRPITDAMRKRLFAIAHERGLSDAELRTKVVKVCQNDGTTREMTREQYRQVEAEIAPVPFT